MLQRTSIVNHLKVETISFSSFLEIGDSSYIQGFSRAIAVQREAEIFFGNEAQFQSYSIFKESIPLPPITEVITMNTIQLKPAIKVNTIDILGVSSSSVFHVGNSKHVQLESRVEHIRHLTRDSLNGKR
ncbi:spore germination protein PE [Cytobacillus eiseniae]|uniref:Spore germination protein PE n=1 Tax=Cytobacillus eiseniae TaxID=762947 RepID=A0ABS4REF8_9BACI|nr:spore germination protein GerPE [Cytobacillus eiseniae]MBP2241118.1 spore germination protein PE [Cytobacillus eiseniae]